MQILQAEALQPGQLLGSKAGISRAAPASAAVEGPVSQWLGLDTLSTV